MESYDSVQLEIWNNLLNNGYHSDMIQSMYCDVEIRFSSRS